MPLLTVKRSGKLIRRFAFQGDIITIGRESLESSEGPDLALMDRSRRVSRYHAAIISNPEGRYFVRDLASANGTYVNGSLVHGCYLNESDRISLGGFDMVYTIENEEKIDLSNAIRVISASQVPEGDDRKTYLEDIPEEAPEDFSERMQQNLHDILHYLRTLSGSDGFFEELLCSVIPPVEARRGMVARCSGAESVIPLTLYGIDIDHGGCMNVSAEYITRALSEKKTVNAFFAGRAVLCAAINMGPTEKGVVYIEKRRGEGFSIEEQRFFEILCEKAGQFLPKAATEDKSRIDKLERFPWKTNMVAKSLCMRPVVSDVEAACDIDSNVLLRGDTGTGKEVTARTIHEKSARCENPFVPVELSNLEKEMVSGTLFGWVKGAYTGADRESAGAFERAHGGSIFLDEIGDISPDVQVKLRRAVEEKEIYPVGSANPVKVDVKVLAATNADLEQMVENASFREDLLQRFGKTIRLPALKERAADIPLLVCFFIDKSEPPLRAVSHGAMRLLTQYDWPGNIRELREVIKQLAARNKEYIFSFDLPERFYAGEGAKVDKKVPTLQEREKQEIIRVLNQVGWNKSRAARMLGFRSKQTLYNKIEKYGITHSQDQAANNNE